MTENKYPKPSNGSLICTFYDCPYRLNLTHPVSNYHWVEIYHAPPLECKADCTHKNGGGYYCENKVIPGDCPLGFVR